jgi:hypothetical protein
MSYLHFPDAFAAISFQQARWIVLKNFWRAARFNLRRLSIATPASQAERLNPNLVYLSAISFRINIHLKPSFMTFT